MNRKLNALRIRRLTYAALYLAIALVLPFLTGQIPEIGSMLCPMHIPVLLCGFVCGWPYGLAVGAISPLLRSVMFGMPGLYPTAIAMTFELAAYGAAAGLLYRLFPKRMWGVYAALIGAMLLGRVVWGIADYFLLQLRGEVFTPEMFVSGAVVSALPGIILHLVIIPPIVMALEKAKLTVHG
ncbi:MAG: ECF transporter S component [Aristaeellaceae bacterium]